MTTAKQTSVATQDELFIEVSVSAKREIATGAFLFELVAPGGVSAHGNVRRLGKLEWILLPNC